MKGELKKMNSEFGSSVSFDEFERLHGDGNSESMNIPSVGLLWRELKSITFPEIERVLFGLGRGQVGLVVASTNIGKTTLALNLTLTLASGGTFPPIIKESSAGRRVMFIDGESTKGEFQADLKRMMRDWSPFEQLSIDDNLLVLCDEEIGDALLNLSDPNHMAAVMLKAQEFKPDLIIVDTMAALFDLENENDNAEIKSRVMSPLKRLAREANATVWLQHHVGKQSEEARTNAHAYLGRGGSNLGALARSVVTLTVPDRRDPQRVILSVPKSKGYHLPDVVMHLDLASRWFTVKDEAAPKVASSLDDVVQFVTKEMSTAEIVEAFKGKYGKRTVEDNLSLAVERELLRKARRGRYAPVSSTPSADVNSCFGNFGNGDEKGDDSDIDCANVSDEDNDLPF
jgi:RecA-family ATPase